MIIASSKEFQYFESCAVDLGGDAISVDAGKVSGKASIEEATIEGLIEGIQPPTQVVETLDAACPRKVNSSGVHDLVQGLSRLDNTAVVPRSRRLQGLFTDYAPGEMDWMLSKVDKPSEWNESWCWKWFDSWRKYIGQ